MVVGIVVRECNMDDKRSKQLDCLMHVILYQPSDSENMHDYWAINAFHIYVADEESYII